MAILGAFTFENNIYHFLIEEGEKVTIGSGKKDTVLVTALQDGQVAVFWKRGKGIFLSSKDPFYFPNQAIDLNRMTVMNQPAGQLQ